MKKILAFTALLFATTLCANAQAVINFEKKTHNFGTFTDDKEMVYEFVFTNTGDKPLVINQAFSSCGCTVPTFTETPVQPGEKGVIKVRYNGKGTFGGPFKKPVTIRSNASNSMVRIYVEGVVETKKQ